MTHDYPKKPNLLKLATKITLEGLTYTGVGYNDPEYKIISCIVDDEMCECCMHLKMDTPRSLSDVARRCKKDEKWTEAQLNKLIKAGIVRYYPLEDGSMGYSYPIWVPGIMEGILTNKENVEKYAVIGESFEEYTRRRLEVLVPFLDRGMAFMRVMPVNSAIENDTRKADYDELNRIIENATAISVGPCSCRRSRRIMGEGCGHLEEDMCMYLNNNAITYSKTGAHRLISKEEAYEILARAEENGLMHEVNQTLGFDEVNAICNCCSCSCFALRIAAYFKRPEGIASNYIARVNTDNCVACGQCVEACPVNALKLGDKLVEIVPTELPDSHRDIKTTILNKKAYNHEYRTNRSDVVATGTAPCKAACPAHIAVQGYLKLAGKGRYREALELIKKENPFPAICGRICNKPCEEACTRVIIDEAVAIDDIKKFIAEKDLSPETRFVPKMLNQTGRPYTEKIAVIGAGPAGMSCAYFLAIKGYPVTVFEKEDKPGGMLTLGIPEFRLGREVINSEIDVLKEMGVNFVTGVEIGKDKSLDELRAEGYRAFYLAIGAQNGAKLSIPGEELNGVYSGIDFLRELNLGKKLELGGRVAVIGGGNVAIDVARSAVRLGAKVTLVYRRKEEDMPADPEEVAEARAEGVRFLFEHKPVEITGKNGKVKMLKCEGDECEIDSVISAIGQSIDLNGFDLKAGIKGNVLIDPKTYQTSMPDVFAGGDVVTGPQFVIDAIAAGKEGAISIHRYVHEGQSLVIGRDNRDYKPIDKSNMSFSLSGFDNSPRQRPVNGDPQKARKSFKDLRGVMTEEQIKKEAARCLGCGAVELDEYMCLGCGLCTTKCKFDAIKLEKICEYKGTPYHKTLLGVAGHLPVSIAKTVSNKRKYSRGKN